MDIVKYEVLNTNKLDRNLPYLNSKNKLVVPNMNGYKYYCICNRYNPAIDEIEWFILFSKKKVNNQFISCKYDLNRIVITPPIGKFRDFIYDKFRDKPNLNLEFIESENGYDSWQIS